MSAHLIAVAAVGWAWVLGATCWAAFWPRERRLADDWLPIVALGAWVGMAVTSLYFCAASLLTNRPGLLATALEIATALAIAWRLRGRMTTSRDSNDIAAARSIASWLVGVAFVQAAAVAAVVAIRTYQTEPYGGWDAWAIWNMHARFLFHAGTEWPELLRVPSIHWTHPDYPWLVPASIARVWTWMGGDAPWGAEIVSLAFAAATVGLLIAVVDRMRGRALALIGGLVLIGTPFFVTFHQHADVALGCAMLAAVAAVMLAGQHPGARGLWWVAGACTGIAAWVKNEGLLFALVFAIVLALEAWRRGERKGIQWFACALVTALLPVIAFKLVVNAPNDLLEQPLGPRLAWLIDLQRHAVILSAAWRDLARFGEWHVMPYAALVLAFAVPGARKLNGSERTLPAVVLLMLAGYYVVYLLSPHDLPGHLESSLVRLLLQLWPLAILGWCLTVPGDGAVTPATVSASQTNRGRRVALFAAVNVVLALGSVALLSRQLAANEFAAARVAGVEMRAALGTGWFGLERAGNDRWAWSEGASSIVLRSAGGAAGRAVTLRFDLRGLGRRTVTVRAAERELWRGVVAEDYVPVTIAGLELPGATATIHFESDAPGVPEAPNPDARKLAFAIYNLRIAR